MPPSTGPAEPHDAGHPPPTEGAASDNPATSRRSINNSTNLPAASSCSPTGRRRGGGAADGVGLITEPADEIATSLTAEVIWPLPRTCCVWWRPPSLVRFNAELLANRYGHPMLVDGNDSTELQEVLAAH
jgi:hypothetical protein